MQRRTFEAPMEWEYQNSGPVDLTSPFAQVAKKKPENLFNSPHKSSTTQSTPYSVFGTPSKVPATSFFTPQLAPKVVAPPFRNPAFTTPRKLDEVGISDASFTDVETSFTDASFVSCAEGSPAPTEASAFPNDTPESDRMSVATIGNTTPTKIDKNSRYSRSSPRWHATGRGEIRPLSRDSPRKELQVLRKRKRHNFDKDVSNVIRYLPSEWEGDATDSDASIGSYQGASQPSSSQQRHQIPPTPQPAKGWFVSALGTMDQYPRAPDHIYGWLRLVLNCFTIGTAIYVGWVVFDAVRSDVRNAHEKARMAMMSSITDCTNHYTSNQCAKGALPALRDLCQKWYDCMSQDQDAVMRVRNTIQEIAEIINTFFNTMNFRASRRSNAQVTPTHAPAYSHVSMMAPDATPAHYRERFETPMSQRYAFIEDDIAGNAGFTYSSTGRRSPIKYHRSPGKSVERSGGSLRW
ncbi:uncharacterized protein TRIVIDRAFT_53915 [Trichoderma virens Gv29-8]|uniref:Brl1/Brr6 domain-containing protein n=1 Tax=Hypocrea virens (strain Gv29-8 / FGSC 10586) TaxID=413071 RepID=G9MRU9_HYPVG|nr:uncharacterized protein TRIVIDRAFT_53915 [Trichoderma virens Gv29-8]EHK22818.1 hypothetical protein TRIVIDRAFT_53915 [Trichoderma virens Gv29-8]